MSDGMIQKCPVCDGWGEREKWDANGYPHPPQMVTCPACKGSGYAGGRERSDIEAVVDARMAAHAAGEEPKGPNPEDPLREAVRELVSDMGCFGGHMQRNSGLGCTCTACQTLAKVRALLGDE